MVVLFQGHQQLPKALPPSPAQPGRFCTPFWSTANKPLIFVITSTNPGGGLKGWLFISLIPVATNRSISQDLLPCRKKDIEENAPMPFSPCCFGKLPALLVPRCLYSALMESCNISRLLCVCLFLSSSPISPQNDFCWQPAFHDAQISLK